MPDDRWDAQWDGVSLEDWEGYDDEGGVPFDDEDDLDSSLVADFLEGETLEERNERILARNAEQREDDRSTTNDLLVPVMKPRTRRRTSVVKVTRPEGEDWMELGGDLGAIRTFVSMRAHARGADLAELVKPTPAGNLCEADRRRYDVLAIIAAEARARKANIEALGSVINRSSTGRVADLVARGKALLGQEG